MRLTVSSSPQHFICTTRKIKCDGEKMVVICANRKPDITSCQLGSTWNKQFVLSWAQQLDMWENKVLLKMRIGSVQGPKNSWATVRRNWSWKNKWTSVTGINDNVRQNVCHSPLVTTYKTSKEIFQMYLQYFISVMENKVFTFKNRRLFFV